MSSNNQNQRLNGLTPLSYIGVNASQPTNFTIASSSPTVDDCRSFNLGDWWLNTTDNSIWYLAASNGLIGTWIQVQGSGTGLLGLTGNTGGEVFPLLSNINLVGDGTTVNIVGNPGTSTLTMSSMGGVQLTLTGNSGGAVGETAGNINVVGSGSISVIGNPGSSTLTISESGATATSFITQAGTAVPVAGVLHINGSNGITTSGAASTVTITAGSTIAQSYVTSPATGTATPSSGVITFAGSGTVISAAGSTVTITGGGSLPSYSTGTFVPFLAFGGSVTGIAYSSRAGVYTRMGNVVFIQIELWVTSLGSATGNASIGGLPFVVSNSYGSFFMETSCFSGINDFPSSLPIQYAWGRFNPGATTMNVFGQGKNLSSASAFAMTNTNFVFSPHPATSFIVQGLYFI